MAKTKLYSDLPERSHPDYMKLYAEKHKEKFKERGKIYREKRLEENPNHYKEQYSKYQETHKKYRSENKAELAEKQWKARGIENFTYVKYIEDLDKQNGNCLICGKKMNKPQVDHDHKTGKYRGILCVPCNNGLGVYELYKENFEKYLSQVAK